MIIQALAFYMFAFVTVAGHIADSPGEAIALLGSRAEDDVAYCEAFVAGSPLT